MSGRTWPAGASASPAAGLDGRGLRSRLADRPARRARARRLRALLAQAQITRETSIVDVGCGPLGLLGIAPELRIVGVDLYGRPGYPGPLVRADATVGLPFKDNAFDLAYCNSVIEHVAPERRGRFAREVRRIARGWYVQTPAYEFPIEPHALLPFAHWLPEPVRRPYWRLGAGTEMEEVHLLRRHELEELFGPARAERLGPFVKSWVSLRLPSDWPARASQPGVREASRA